MKHKLTLSDEELTDIIDALIFFLPLNATLLDRLTQMREFAKDTPSPLYELRET